MSENLTIKEISILLKAEYLIEVYDKLAFKVAGDIQKSQPEKIYLNGEIYESVDFWGDIKQKVKEIQSVKTIQSLQNGTNRNNQIN